MYVDRSGRIWAGTQNGLDQLDLKTGKFTVYYERDGLAGNVVGCILEDERGDLWMSTNRGVSRFDPLRKTFKNYTVIDGLPGLDLTGWGACYKSRNGEMFFGGFSGATAFHPDKVVDRTYVPPIVLTDFRLFGARVELGAGSPLEKSISHTTALTLPTNKTVFSLEFSALSYLDSATNRYRYQLEGLDPTVERSGQRRTSCDLPRHTAGRLHISCASRKLSRRMERAGNGATHRDPTALVGNMVVQEHSRPDDCG